MERHSVRSDRDVIDDDLKSMSRLRGLPRNVWVLTVTSMLTDISSEMLLNLLPLFLYSVLGARTAVIGLIESLAEATASFLKLASGWLSDQLGRRKWLTVIGYGLSTLAKPFLYFATTWGWVLGVRFTDRVGKGIRTAPRDALVADSVGEDQRGLAFGIHRAGDTLGAVLGLIIALVVVLIAQRDSAMLTRSTFQIVVLFSVIPAALAVLILIIGAREKHVTIQGVDHLRRKGVMASGRRIGREVQSIFFSFKPPFRIFLLIITIFTLGNFSDAFRILRAYTVGLSAVGVLGMGVTHNLVYALVSTPVGALSDRVGRHKLLIAGWLLNALVNLGFASASNGWQAWGWMAIYGLYYGMTEGVAKAFVADLVPLEQRGTAYGLFNGAIGFAVLPASLIAGTLWEGVGGWSGLGPRAPFLFSMVMALLAAILLARLPSHEKETTL
jgi:MFS family permease